MLRKVTLPDGIKTIQQAKRFLIGAKVLQSYQDPTYSFRVYQLGNGDIYEETDSLLEFPYDDYVLRKVG